jgi:DNA-binding Xre family transcriptional regulator
MYRLESATTPNTRRSYEPVLQARRLDVEDVVEKSSPTLEQLEGIERGGCKGYRTSAIENLYEALGCESGELFVWRS